MGGRYLFCVFPGKKYVLAGGLMAKKKTVEDYQKEVKHLKALMKELEARRVADYERAYYNGNSNGQRQIREALKNLLEIRELPET